VAFSFPGLSGADMGACWLLPRAVGLGRAADWLLTGREVEAPEALAAGFFSRLVPADRLAAEAAEAARRIARGPKDAAAVTKRLLDGEASMTLEEALRAESAVQSAFMDREDFREAYRAFLEKRDPRFRS
jgi:enoyl-CoA hydratase/carnithine racemase